jgi:alkylated DNA repair dioxygenase AlkB
VPDSAALSKTKIKTCNHNIMNQEPSKLQQYTNQTSKESGKTREEPPPHTRDEHTDSASMSLVSNKGYLVYRQVLKPAFLKRLKLARGTAHGEWHTIQHDEYRCQHHLSDQHPLVIHVKHFLQHHTTFLRGREFGASVLIKSFRGGRRQVMHTDYDAEQVGCAAIKPLGVIVALSKSARLHTPTSTIRLRQGDLLVFTGDFQHAGAAYSKPNYRFHTYLTTAEVPEPDNVTYLVEDDDA